MEMTQELKTESEMAAEAFLKHMPKENWAKYKNQKTHHQLAYFYCWCEIMKQEFKG